jgi:hypothetical protein
MSALSSVAALTRRLPFGIGTVTGLLVAAMVASVGVVLAMGTPDQPTSYGAGQIRGYPDSPAIAWTQSSDTLPGYGSDTDIEVVDTWQDTWLLAYPSGIGRAFLAVDRATGAPRWDQPVTSGLGGCAFDGGGQLGCAIKVGSAPDGFYLIDDDGIPTKRSDLDDTAQVVGVGPNFLRIDQAGYRVSLRAPDGGTVWNRTFAAAASARYTEGVLLVSTADGGEFVVDPSTGRDLIACSVCQLTVYPSGITVQYNGFGDERVEGHAITDGEIGTRPTWVAEGLRVVPGTSTLPVLTGAGDGQIQQTQGRYEVRDPARAAALWQITDPELSKANTRPCGTQVAFALKDRSRLIYSLDEGKKVGELPEPSLDSPDANIDQLQCIGSSGNSLLFGNTNQITAFDVPGGRVAWEYPTIGNARVVDGYIVLTQGTSLSVLRPN